MRIPLYVHSDIPTESSVYPYIGYFDICFRADFATIRCSGQVAVEYSLEDAYFIARMVERKIYKILCSLQEEEKVEVFFDQFWHILIDTDLCSEEDFDIDDDIVLLVSWQGLLPNGIEFEENEIELEENRIEVGESTNSICVSGVGISQIFAGIQENQFVWAPIVQPPHPFFRPLGKPDTTVGYLTINNPLLALGYNSLYTKNISYSEIETQLRERKWDLEREQQALQERWEAVDS